MAKTSYFRQIPNGDEMVDFEYYICSRCDKSVPESWGIIELPGDFLCEECVKGLFFKLYDVMSIPHLEETNGLLGYSSKGKGRRSAIPRELREKVYRRDKHKCKGCGTKNKKSLTIDHIHPYSHGGKDVLSNFQTLCRSCNSKKGAKIEWLPT